MRKVYVFVVVFLLALASSMDAQRRRAVASPSPELPLCALEIVPDAVGNFSVHFTAGYLRAGTSGRGYMVTEDGYELPIARFNLEVTAANENSGFTAWIWGGYASSSKDPVMGDVVPSGVIAFRVRLTGAMNFFWTVDVPGRQAQNAAHSLIPFEKVEYREGRIVLEGLSTPVAVSVQASVFRADSSHWSVSVPPWLEGWSVLMSSACWWDGYPGLKCVTSMVKVSVSSN